MEPPDISRPATRNNQHSQIDGKIPCQLQTGVILALPPQLADAVPCMRKDIDRMNLLLALVRRAMSGVVHAKHSDDF